MSVEVRDINYSVGDKLILKNVSFSIADGEFASLFGASGAGKSTTLKIIAGIVKQTSGNVLIDGAVMDDIPTHKRQTSIVFQDIRLFPHLRVGENIAYPLKMKGLKKVERKREVDRMLDLVQLPGFASRQVYQLSGGQQQRVALARSVVGEPRLLLLDEPFSGLDEELRDDMRQLVLSVHDRLGITTVMITHDATEARLMSDNIVYLKEGMVTDPQEKLHKRTMQKPETPLAN